MESRITDIRDRVFNNKGKEEDIVDTWHNLMVAYGYIPFEEFLDMDDPLVMRLNEKIEEMKKAESTMMPKPSRGRR